MKSYTDLEQSKKLAEILPIESADMYYSDNEYPKQITKYIITYANVLYGSYNIQFFNICEDVQCWSLAALLNVLPKEIEIDGQHYAPCLFPVKNKWLLKLWYNSNYTITSPIAIFADNPVDAYVEMILKLHELKML